MHTARSRNSVISHGCCSNSAASSANAAAAAGAGHDLLRRCELCKEEAARVYCAADEAQLCWGCDERIHSANFLVARHPRALLCPSCGAFLRQTTSTPASATQQLICYTCRGGGAGWLDSDEESKILDQSAADEDFEDDYRDDDQEDQNSSRGHDYQSRSSGSGHSRKLNVLSRPWSAANGRIQQNYDDMGFMRGLLPSEEGMGDSQDEDYGISH